ncbi:Hypothetical predicted protein, partial [Marmota monax]
HKTLTGPQDVQRKASEDVPGTGNCSREPTSRHSTLEILQAAGGGRLRVGVVATYTLPVLCSTCTNTPVNF